jgi:hypothetical protein
MAAIRKVFSWEASALASLLAAMLSTNLVLIGRNSAPKWRHMLAQDVSPG